MNFVIKLNFIFQTPTSHFDRMVDAPGKQK
jgi:hypothetical protein